MARLREGEKQQVLMRVQQLLNRSQNGIKESEMAQLMSMDRRRLNNYLRELQQSGKANKDGRAWFPE
ncbi:MAG: hypothetical protein AAF639_44995 [Chloroflexota bacterium]